MLSQDIRFPRANWPRKLRRLWRPRSAAEPVVQAGVAVKSANPHGIGRTIRAQQDCQQHNAIL